tara:strand:+ start:3878 stop:4048 length:171 start_codon:yes stop_codon:yes gene_type:complete
MSKLENKLIQYALKYREWSKDKLWAKIPLWILLLWMLGFFNPYWCVYPVCWIPGIN